MKKIDFTIKGTKLPKINGYKGEIDGDMVKYGCAAFKIDKLRSLLDIRELSGCRRISSIKLSSGITITIEDIEQIIKYVDKN